MQAGRPTSANERNLVQMPQTAINLPMALHIDVDEVLRCSHRKKLLIK